MARTRYIKPGFFTNDHLSELKVIARLLFAGLWCVADREGRLEDRPKRIKAELLPFDSVDCDRLLQSLNDAGFILRYEAGDKRYIQIVNFVKHQQPHHKELPSQIPAPEGHADSLYPGGGVSKEQAERVMARDGRQCQSCGATDRLSIDHVVPQSKGGGHEDSNLKVLCKTCNSRKGNRNVDSTLTQARADVAPLSTLVPLNLEPLKGNGEGKRKKPPATPSEALADADFIADIRAGKPISDETFVHECKKLQTYLEEHPVKNVRNFIRNWFFKVPAEEEEESPEDFYERHTKVAEERMAIWNSR